MVTPIVVGSSVRIILHCLAKKSPLAKRTLARLVPLVSGTILIFPATERRPAARRGKAMANSYFALTCVPGS